MAQFIDAQENIIFFPKDFIPLSDPVDVCLPHTSPPLPVSAPVPPPCSLVHCTIDSPHVAGGVLHYCPRVSEPRFFSLAPEGSVWLVVDGVLHLSRGSVTASTNTPSDRLIATVGAAVFTSCRMVFPSSWRMVVSSLDLSQAEL